MTKIAVLDLGSARTKMIIASQNTDGTISLSQFKEETGIAGKVGSDCIISIDVSELICHSIKRLLSLAIQNGVYYISAVATDVFRRAKNSEEILRSFEPLVGKVSVLSTMTEGQIFFSSMNSIINKNETMAVLDIGGGSVQIVWGEQSSDVVSLPTGTFQLENQFQEDREPNEMDYLAMTHYIRNQAMCKLPSSIRRHTVIMGSNCMQDFISSALRECFGENPNKFYEIKAITLTDINLLFLQIKGKPYDTLWRYYPSNPQFMRGADKALLNILTIASLLNAKQIIPTNESVGSSIARIALTDPDKLKKYGLTIHQI